MSHFQPFDEVTHNGRKAIVVYLWPDRILVRLCYDDTGQKRSVLVSEVRRLDPVAESVDAVRAAFAELDHAGVRP